MCPSCSSTTRLAILHLIRRYGAPIINCCVDNLPIWHNLTSTSAHLLGAQLRSDIVPSFRHPLGVGSETEGILKLH